MKNLLPKIFFGISLLALAGVIFIIIQSSKIKNSTLTETWLSAIKPKEKVIIDEYSDFQCPACRQAAPILEDLKKRYPEKIEIRYHHFPLSYHRWSKKAAEAAEAARAQGKFWEYHNLLFAKQDEWENSADALSLFKKYAQNLGLDINEFEKDLNSGKYSGKIEKDLEEGEKLKVDATPTLFVNGIKVSGGFQTWEEFKIKIEEKIKQN